MNQTQNICSSISDYGNICDFKFLLLFDLSMYYGDRVRGHSHVINIGTHLYRNHILEVHDI